MVVIERNLFRLNPRVDLERYAFTPQERELCERLAADFVDLPQLRAQTGLPEDLVRRLLYVLRVTHALILLPHVRRSLSGPVARAHPPSVPSPELDGQEAHAHAQVQQDDTVKSDAPRGGRARAATPPQAEAHYQRAQRLLKQKDYSQGLREAREAVKRGATHAEHQALYAWLLYQHGGGGDRIHPRVWEHLEHALKRDPRCERAHHYKASLLKRMGQLDHAYVHYKRALKLDNNNLEAAREVRLYEMRKRHEQQSAGLVDRLFRRHK
jgi:tetratricopeptide (TPR) repeat protein